jgi:outer membrane protein
LLFAGALALVGAAVPVAQAEQGDWLIKGGATMVDPKSDNLKIGDLGPIEGVGTVTNAALEVDDGTSFGFTVTYMFTDNWAVELLAAWPFKHDIDLTFALNGDPMSFKLGDTEHLPPTVSVQYHFLPDTKFDPYVGVGFNYTLFSNEKLTSDSEAFFELLGPELGLDLTNPKLKLDNSSGVAAQIGADIYFSDAWFANIDFRYIDIGTDPTITSDVDSLKLKTVNIDPFVYSIMLGYRF